MSFRISDGGVILVRARAAARSVRSARALTAALVTALACLGWIAGAPSVAALESSRDLAVKGKRLFDQGDLAGSLEALRGAAGAVEKEGRPDADLVDFLGLNLYNLGVRLNNDGDPDGALECLLAALRVGRLGPRMRDENFRDQLKEAALAVGRYLIDARRPARALEVYNILITENSGADVRPVLGLGSAQLAMGDLEASRRSFETAVARDPNSAEAVAGMGRVALRLGSESLGAGGPSLPATEEAVDRLTSAVDWMRRARDLEPRSATREKELAEALGQLGRAEARAGDSSGSARRAGEAEASLRAAARLAPTSPWLRIDLALFLFKARRYEESASLFREVDAMLVGLLAQRPADREAPAWRDGLASCKDNEAAASYNLAVDAVNRAEFAQVEEHLRRVCGAGDRWEPTCRALGEAARSREAAFKQEVDAREKNLSRDPGSARDLLALGDLYADVGAWNRALTYYERLRAAGSTDPALRDRLAAVQGDSDLKELIRTIPLTGCRVRLVYYREALGADLETALKAAWLRVTTSLGEDALRGDLLVTVYPSQRVFREKAGYRVGAFVKGNYAPGRVSVFETPSHTLVEWVTVLTHEMAHHGVDRLSGAASPWWLSEGIARYVEGDAAVVDRVRLRRRLQGSRLQPLDRLDDVIDRSWNDAEVHLDVRDTALLAVEEMARRKGTDGLKRILKSLAAAPLGSSAPAGVDGIVRGVLGAGLTDLDGAWRAALLRSP